MPVSKTTIERSAAYHDLWDDWASGVGVKRLSPQALRGKIRTFLQKYNVTVTSFQKVIGVNANTYGTFMTGKYKHASSALSNGTYWNAGYFFWSDEQLNQQDSIIKKLKASASAAEKAGDGAAGKKPPLPDVSAIQLDSHDVYLNPKEVRAEVSTLKTKYKCTNADLAKAVWPEKAAATSQPGAPVGRFLAQGGEFGGEEMDFYRPCALFCEKVRVFENRPKSKKRKALQEEAQATGRAPFLGLNPNKKYWMGPGVGFIQEGRARQAHHPRPGVVSLRNERRDGPSREHGVRSETRTTRRTTTNEDDAKKESHQTRTRTRTTVRHKEKKKFLFT